MASTYGDITYGDFTYGVVGVVAQSRPRVHVRERPPLRLSIDAESPNGRHYRWAEDERNPADRLSGLRFSSTMPGGDETCDCTLPRKAGVDYSDLDRLTRFNVLGPPNDIRGQFRLERAPRTSGDQMAISPSAAGFQAALEDNKSAMMVYVHRDLSAWEPMSTARRLSALASFTPNDHRVDATPTSGAPSLITEVNGAWGAAAARPICEAFLNCQGVDLSDLYIYAKRGNTVINHLDGNWSWSSYLSSDDIFTSFIGSGAYAGGGGPYADLLTNDSVARSYAAVQLFYGAGPAGVDNQAYPIHYDVLAVYGRHGLTKRGSYTATGAPGFYASDVIAHAVETWAPQLAFSRGVDGTIQDTDFSIDHLSFLEPTTAAAIIAEANRFHVRDWQVRPGPDGEPTFYYHERGLRGRKWRGRSGPTELSQTGQQIDRLWNAVVVQYQDVDGTAKFVGPPGWGGTMESSRLVDPDTENPATKVGITRCDLLQAGTMTQAGAIELGYRFLVESKALDTSGSAKFVGWVEDDKGVMHPASRIRAGDQVAFTDASDPSYRRIVKVDYNHSDRTASVDLDSPPEGLQALLQRLGAVLVPLGLS